MIVDWTLLPRELWHVIVRYDDFMILTLRSTCKYACNMIMSLPSNSNRDDVDSMLTHGDVVGLLKYTLCRCAGGPTGFTEILSLADRLVKRENLDAIMRVSFTTMRWVSRVITTKYLYDQSVETDDALYAHYRSVWFAAAKVDEPRALDLMPQDILDAVINNDEVLYQFGSARVYARLLDTNWLKLSDAAVRMEESWIITAGKAHPNTTDDDVRVGRLYMLEELNMRYPLRS